MMNSSTTHAPTQPTHAIIIRVFGKPALKIEPISNGTVTETGKTNGESERKANEIVEKVGAGDGI